MFRIFGWEEGCLFVSVHRPFQILSLSRAVWTSNDKWFLIVDGEFFSSLSCQHLGNFIQTDHPDFQKKFRVDCVILNLWIFQTGRAQGED